MKKEPVTRKGQGAGGGRMTTYNARCQHITIPRMAVLMMYVNGEGVAGDGLIDGGLRLRDDYPLRGYCMFES